jgi:hypothetical protein
LKGVMDEIQSFANRYRLKTRFSDDGTRIVPGKFGHIYLYDDDVLGVMVMPNPPRRNYWGHVCATLLRAGFVVVQDGDCEGAATFDPTNPNQEELAIRAAGIKPKRRVSPEQRKRQTERLRASAGRPLCPPGTRGRPEVKPSLIFCELERSGSGNSSCGSIGHLVLDPQRDGWPAVKRLGCHTESRRTAVGRRIRGSLRPVTHNRNRGAK